MTHRPDATTRPSLFRRLAAHCRHPGRGAWFAIAIAIATAIGSQHAHAAAGDPPAAAAPAPAPATATAPAAIAPNWRDLHVDVVGSGRPVLMIPGLNSAGAVWQDTCRALQPGVQCHIVQLPGFAGLAPVSTDRWLESMRDRLLAYVDERHLPSPVVMGHSLGGVLALMMSEKAPDRLDRLVIVDSLPFFTAIRNPAATEADGRAAAAQMREQFGKATPEQMQAMRLATARGMTRSAEGVDAVVRWGDASDAATTGEAMAEMMETDLRPRLAAIRRPVLVLGSWAAYAPMGATMEGTRGIFEAQYAKLAGVQIRMSERGYHFLMWDDAPWLVSQVREFATLR